MGAVLLLGVIAGAWLVANWYFELLPFVNNRYFPEEHKSFVIRLYRAVAGIFINAYRFIYYGKYFLIDLLLTVLIASMFSFGQGITGAIVGIFISNFASVVLLVIMKKDEKRKNNIIQGI